MVKSVTNTNYLSKKYKYAHGNIKTNPIKTVDPVETFSQGRVDEQLVTCQMLRHRLFLSSLFFTFHYIGQKLKRYNFKYRFS